MFLLCSRYGNSAAERTSTDLDSASYAPLLTAMAQMFQNLQRTLSGHRTLKIRCEICDHRATLKAGEARLRCGPDATPMDIRRRAKCGSCGAEGHARVWI